MGHGGEEFLMLGFISNLGYTRMSFLKESELLSSALNACFH